MTTQGDATPIYWVWDYELKRLPAQDDRTKVTMKATEVLTLTDHHATLAAANAPPTRTWTSARPNDEGWYWWYGHYGAPKQVARVFRTSNKLVVSYRVFGDDRLYEMDVKDCEGYWAGPLDSPPQEGA